MPANCTCNFVIQCVKHTSKPPSKSHCRQLFIANGLRTAHRQEHFLSLSLFLQFPSIYFRRSSQKERAISV